MRVAFAGVLLAALVPQEGGPPTGSVTIPTAAGKPGDRWQIESTIVQQLSVTFRARETTIRTFEQELADHGSWEVTLVAPETAEVTYGDCKSRLVTPKSDDEQELAVHQQRFRVTLAPTGQAATPKPPLEPAVEQAGFDVVSLVGPDSQAVPVVPELARRVARDVREPLLGGCVAAALQGRNVELGQPFDAPSELGRALFSELLLDADLTRFTLSPQAVADEAGQPCLLFHAEVAAEMTSTPGEDELPVTSNFSLSGPIAVHRGNGRIVRLELAGTVRCRGSSQEGGGTVEVDGSGRLSWNYRARPRVE